MLLQLTQLQVFQFGANEDKPIDIDSTTADIDASDAITLDSQQGISIDSGAASNFTTSAGDLTLIGAEGVNMPLHGVMTTVNGTLNVDEAVTFDTTSQLETGIDGDFDVNNDKFTVAATSGKYRCGRYIRCYWCHHIIKQ